MQRTGPLKIQAGDLFSLISSLSHFLSGKRLIFSAGNVKIKERKSREEWEGSFLW